MKTKKGLLTPVKTKPERPEPVVIIGQGRYVKIWPPSRPTDPNWLERALSLLGFV